MYMHMDNYWYGATGKYGTAGGLRDNQSQISINQSTGKEENNCHNLLRLRWRPRAGQVAWQAQYILWELVLGT